jgi:hypothetical protein
MEYASHRESAVVFIESGISDLESSVEGNANEANTCCQAKDDKLQSEFSRILIMTFNLLDKVNSPYRSTTSEYLLLFNLNPNSCLYARQATSYVTIAALLTLASPCARPSSPTYYSRAIFTTSLLLTQP